MKRRKHLGTTIVSILTFAMVSATALSTVTMGAETVQTAKIEGTVKITANQINNGGYVIKEPGNYILTENVDWVASDANAKAITIESDNVHLDLGGYTIRQVNKPKPVENDNPGVVTKSPVISGNVAIYGKYVNGVTVKNGNVLDVQGVGICFQSVQFLDLIDLTARNCGGNGAVDTSFLYRNGGIFVMGNQRSSSDIDWSSDVRIINCIAVENTSKLDYVVTLGSLVQHTNNVIVRDSVFNRTSNTSPQPSGVQFNVVGIDFVQCRNVLVENCEANDNTSGGEPAGFFAWGENYKFVNCRANRNYTLTGNRACGFNVSTTVNLEMIDCEADGNYNKNLKASTDATQDFSAAGFRLGRAIDRALIQNCRAIGNYSVGSNSPVAGFMLNSTSNVTLLDCVATANRNTGGSKAAGFMASTVLKDKDGSMVGGYDNSFINCIADGNTVNVKPLYEQSPYPQVDAGAEVYGNEGLGAGFLLQDQKNVKVLDSYAYNNFGKGIWLINSQNSLIENNVLTMNSVYGIDVETPQGNNLYINNRARLNGYDPSFNYNGLSEIDLEQNSSK